MSPMPEATTEYAARVLADALGWTLRASGWRQVAEQVGALDSALAQADEAGCREALRRLALLGPSRVGRIGRLAADEPAAPPPPETLDLMNRLIHSLRPGAPHPPTREDGPR